MVNNYKVYMHISPNGKRYIGITNRNPERRWGNGEGYSYNEHFYRAIQKYGWDNFQHLILIDGISREKAAQMEVELIAQYKSNNEYYGYNLCEGGRGGCSGYKHTEAARCRISKAMSTRTVSEETRQKIREVNIGLHDSDYFRNMQKKSTIHYGEDNHMWGRKGKLHHRSRPIQRLDKVTGAVLETYESINLARIAMGVMSNAHIIAVCKGKKPSIYGYKWSYADDENPDDRLEAV